MIEISLQQASNNLKVLNLKGRIDGLSSPDLEKEFEKLTSSGERVIAIDFSYVTYVSSAGLRTFLQTQKTLKKIGGELILISIPENILEVFKISGFINLFKIVKNLSELSHEGIDLPENNFKIISQNGLTASYIKLNSNRGKINIFGSQDKLGPSSYAIDDVVEIEPGSITFGTGLAALGSSFEEYKDLFGEAMILNNSFFYYPAIKASRVDYVLGNEIDSLVSYKFLHGFGFSGGYSHIIKFDEQDSLINLAGAINIFNQLVESELYGITFIGTSGGTYGMNLKKSPIIGNEPANGRIFDQGNFMDWMDYPIDPVFANHILAGTGVASKDRSKLPAELKSIFSSESNFHIHTGIFEKDLLCKNIPEFNNELNRILSELQVLKIQHLLGQSLFKNCVFGIIELEVK